MRWHGCELEPPRAGALTAATLELENAGTATWRARPHYDGVHVGYHWLDERGNPIVWDGLRTPVVGPIQPGARIRMHARVRGPLPPGRYQLAFDLVEEGRFWLAELGNAPLELDVHVAPRIERRLAVRGGHAAALEGQEETLVGEADAAAVAYLGDGVAPPPDWSRRVLDAHQEGYAVVGGAIAFGRGLLRKPPKALAPWAPGPGRVPTFPHPLLCPSVVRGVEPEWADAVEGLPAVHAPADEPWLYDGRIVVTARPRSGRRRG